MNNSNYKKQLRLIIKHYKRPIQVEIINTFVQTMDDFDLEENDEESIINKLGTPQEFLEEYIQERLIGSQIISNQFQRNKLEISFVVIKILGLFSLLLIPIVASYDSKKTNYIPIIFLYYISGIIYFSTYKISHYYSKKITNFGQIFYNIYLFLILFIFANLVTDDYVYLFEDLFWVYIPGFGAYVSWLLPAIILLGLRQTMMKEGIDIKKDTRYEDSRFVDRIKSITRIIIMISTFLIYIWDELVFLLWGMFLSSIVLILEYLILSHKLSNPKNLFQYRMDRKFSFLFINLVLISEFIIVNLLQSIY